MLLKEKNKSEASTLLLKKKNKSYPLMPYEKINFATIKPDEV